VDKLIEAGKVALAWQEKMAACNKRLTELGYPNLTGSNAGAPFDRLSDNLRGQRGIAIDMYRQPAKLLKALDRVTRMMIDAGVRGARMGNAPIVNFNLHKGADGFMSDEQFKIFYWDSLRKVIVGLAEEGLMSRLGAQGGYNTRLEHIRNVPNGMTIWALGYATDMAKGKEALGGIACIMGNLLASRLHAASKDDVIADCKWLIDTAGKGGGYMFSTSSIDRHAKPENVWAMLKFVKEYGVY
jgi:uroporphyrinogen-III decarboxylase